MRAIVAVGMVAVLAVGAWFLIGPGAGPPIGACSAPLGTVDAGEPRPPDAPTTLRWLDATTLSAGPEFDDEEIVAVVAFDGRFVAAGRRSNGAQSNAFVLTSTDGERWSGGTSHARFGRAEIDSLAVAGGRLFALGSAPTDDRGGTRGVVWFTDDAVMWTEALGPFTDRWVDAIAAGDDALLLVGGNARSTIPAAWQSEDGAAWESVPIEVPGSLADASFADLVQTPVGWLAVGSLSRGPDAASAAVAWHSTDGARWSCEVLPVDQDFRTIAMRVLVTESGDRRLVLGDASRGCGIGASCIGYVIAWAGYPAAWEWGDAPGSALDAVGDSPLLWYPHFLVEAGGFLAVGGGAWASEDGSSWTRLDENGDGPLGQVSAGVAAEDRIVVGGAVWNAAGDDADAWLAVGELGP
jgi:hypothetical protein